MLTAVIGGGEPWYSLPAIVSSTRSPAPAPRMLPVAVYPGMGTKRAWKPTVGAPDATPQSADTVADTAAERTARRATGLRIGAFSPLRRRHTPASPSRAG